MAGIQPGPKKRETPKGWAEPIKEWDEWMVARGLTDQTRYGWQHKVLAYARTSGLTPDQTKDKDIIAYMARGVSGSTLRSDHSALRSFFSLWSQRTGKPDPMRLVPLAKRRIRKLPPAKEEAVKRGIHADKRTALMVLLMARMGLRRAEVARISVDDITGTGSDMTLVVHGKGDKDRILPVDQAVAGRLEEAVKHAQGKWLFPSTNHSVVSGNHISAGRVGRIVGRTTGCPAHSFRRLFATDLWQATDDVMIVKEMLGHSSLDTTQNYIWTTQEELRNAMNRLDQWRHGKPSTKLTNPAKILTAYGVPSAVAGDIVRLIRESFE